MIIEVDLDPYLILSDNCPSYSYQVFLNKTSKGEINGKTYN